MIQFSAKKPIFRRSPSTWYMSSVNINYSFKTLERLALKLGANIEDGDVLVVDNRKMDKRKAYKKTINGHIIVYVALLNHNLFQPYESNGLIGEATPLIDFFKA